MPDLKIVYSEIMKRETVWLKMVVELPEVLYT